MALLLWLRFAKLVAVILLFAGTLGVVMSPEIGARRRFATVLVGPGFGLTWALGFVLVRFTGHSLLSAFILGAMGLSILSLQGVLYLAGKAERRGALAALVALVPLLGAVWLMIFRPGG
jgi:hypothetical protein